MANRKCSFCHANLDRLVFGRVMGGSTSGVAWKRGRGASAIAAKEAVKSAAFVILALALMLYLMDLLLYAIEKGVYGNSYFSGNVSVITAFRDLATKTENGGNAGALILNALMYDALGGGSMSCMRT